MGCSLSEVEILKHQNLMFSVNTVVFSKSKNALQFQWDSGGEASFISRVFEFEASQFRNLKTNIGRFTALDYVLARSSQPYVHRVDSQRYTQISISRNYDTTGAHIEKDGKNYIFIF